MLYYIILNHAILLTRTLSTDHITGVIYYISCICILNYKTIYYVRSFRGANADADHYLAKFTLPETKNKD